MSLLKRRFFGYTLAYILEGYGGYIIFIFSMIICMFFLKPEYSKCKDLIKEFPTIGMCAFGFLLTFLGIILQGDSETIKWFKSRKKLYNRFLETNKRIVVMSLIVSLFSYLVGYLNMNIFNELIYVYKEFINIFVVSLFISLLLKFIYDFWIFIKIFYSLLKES